MSNVGNLPAFPQTMVPDPNGGLTCGWQGYGMGGMSLRDYFAAKALQGMLAYSSESGDWGNISAERVAIAAYAHADAMLAERDK